MLIKNDVMPSKSINKTLGGLTVRLYVNKAEQLKAQRLLNEMPDIYLAFFVDIVI